MAPHPHRVELDMDRKEELIIAKQLRACRVNILPRNVEPRYQSSLSPSPAPSPRTPESPNQQQHNTYKDSSPIAMRYWNQCQSIRALESDNKVPPVTEQDVVDELAMKMKKLTQKKAKDQSAPKAAVLATVPDIRNKMKESTIPSSPKILITDTEKLKVSNADIEKPKSDKNVDTFKVLSTAGSGISRENEKSEAKSNLQRFITVDQIQKPQDFSLPENKPKVHLPPKLPFLNDIHLLKKQEPKSPPKHQEQVQTIPDLPKKNKINNHIGHIENRPTFGDLPFLNDIKSLSGLNTEATVDLKQKAVKSVDPVHIAGAVSRTSPTVEESAYVREKIQNDILKYNEDRKLKSTSPKTEKSSKKEIVKTTSQRNSYVEPLETTATYGQKQNPSDLKSQNDTTKYNKDRKLKSPSPKIVRFSEKEIDRKSSQRNSYVETQDTIADGQDERETNPSDLKPTKPPKTKKAMKYNIKIDEHSNMSKLADQIIPQANAMQKNFLGLLFFNELSQNIVEDIVAQQLTMMPGTKLASVINSLEQQVCDTAVPLMLNCVSEELRTALVCETFGDLDTEEKAGVLFTTGDDVMEVCSTITHFGGRGFKKALIKNMIANEGKQFMDEIVQEHLKDQRKMNSRTNGALGAKPQVYSDDHKHLSSADDENYNSAEETLADVGDDEVYQYEYYDFENK
eukprot:GFUD01031839.1.p1 GENE.GFUD01031839.1~~GFUD01031839.1.p1  ORF type:complete len:682 (-),score=163.71 GFUD01031839.1:135-2180(-)